MKSDIEIAQAIELRPIQAVARSIGLADSELWAHGPYIAKVPLGVMGRLADRPEGKLILVTAMTPPPKGAGKTTTTIGLGPGPGPQRPPRDGRHSRALAGALHGDERGRGGWRVLAGVAHGGHQPPFHGRSARRHHGPQPVRGGRGQPPASPARCRKSIRAGSSGSG